MILFEKILTMPLFYTTILVLGFAVGFNEISCAQKQNCCNCRPNKKEKGKRDNDLLSSSLFSPIAKQIYIAIEKIYILHASKKY